jgi:DNA-binding winged helix-turn-helix (wHTH) protein/tetratricopeptide (TPR) repeat protein
MTGPLGLGYSSHVMTPRLRFGVFDLDPDAGELWRNGFLVPLQKQPFKVLACLATRAGQIVSREDLKREVWDGATFVDFDGGLNFCVNRIRRVLGDDADAPLYIETVPRRGYRFVAPVTVEEAMAAPAPSRAPAAARSWLWPRLTVAAGLLTAAFLQQGQSPPAEPGRVLDGIAPAARAAYLRGVYQAGRDAGQAESEAALLEAVRLEPGFAAAHAALAESYLRQVELGLVLPREGMPKARAAALRALALSDLATAHAVLGSVALRYDWDWAASERSLLRAMEHDPRAVRTHVEYADLLLVRGRTAEAIREARRAEELDPVCVLVRGRVAGSFYAARRFGEAAEAWRRAAAVDPSLIGPHERLFHAYRHASRPGEALAEASRVVALLGEPGGAPRLLAAPTPAPPITITGFMRGTIEYLGRDERTPGLFSDRIAVLHAALGDADASLRWLEVAVRERSTSLPVTLATDPDLDLLRADPRFQALLAAVFTS